MPNMGVEFITPRSGVTLSQPGTPVTDNSLKNECMPFFFDWIDLEKERNKGRVCTVGTRLVFSKYLCCALSFQKKHW